jgi:hypothetical protein
LTSPKGYKSQIRQILPSYPADFERLGLIAKVCKVY